MYCLEGLTCVFYRGRVGTLIRAREVKSVKSLYIISFVLLTSVLWRVCPINKNLALVFFSIACDISCCECILFISCIFGVQ